MTTRQADLEIVGLGSVGAALVLLANPGSIAVALIAGLPLALVLPGYGLTRALFRERLPNPADYVVLSLALSLAVTILGGLVLELLWPSSRPLSSHSWPVLLSAVTVGCCAIAQVRGHVGPGPPPRPRRPGVRDVLALGAAAVITSGAVALARAPLPAPKGVTGYTQLWLVPRAPTAQLGVHSEELRPMRYELRLKLDGRVDRIWRLALRPGQSWAVELPINSTHGGWHLAEAALYRQGHPGGPYRRVRVNLGTAAERRRG
jgi:hypothetical protein